MTSRGKIYRLTTPKDADGQPLRLFKAREENNTAKAIDQLTGICAGILADGSVNPKEAEFFSAWLQKYAPLEPVWPFTDVLKRVEQIFADGRVSEEECEDLRGVMEALCGYTSNAKPEETYSTSLPLDDPLPEPVVFPEKVFNITGKFAYGTRTKVVEAIKNAGGKALDSSPTRESNYLIIGLFASRDWIHTSHGRKIERAVELRDSGSGIAIISEEHWKKFLV
jgi:NAD-dependent DNA ligase